MNFNDLYHYVFGTKAIIVVDRHIMDPAQEEVIRKTKEEKIRQAFAEVIGTQGLLHFQFYVMLSAEKQASAKALQAILYPTPLHGDPSVTDLTYQFPHASTLKQLFIKLNKTYHYFLDATVAQAQVDFIVLFRVCKLQGDYLEQNPDPYFDDYANHAYKLLVLFGVFHPHDNKEHNPLKYVNQFFRAHVRGKVVFQTLLKSAFPTHRSPLKDLPAWRRLLNKHGRKVLQIVRLGVEVERKLGSRGPISWGEAETTVNNLRFARGAENPALESICLEHRQDENYFNACLELTKRCKTEDVLPDIIVDGNTIELPGAKGYCLVKLPFDDLNVYVLGMLSKCCQQVNGQGHHCIVDGITKTKNGFYVLLKERHEPKDPVFLAGHINYMDYQIVGQGYAWLSDVGNLTFDSWENAEHEDDAAVVPLLQVFSMRATELFDNIVRVTIGIISKKTPEVFKKSPLTLRENMAAGFEILHDAKHQVNIYVNELKKNQIRTALVDKLAEYQTGLWKDRNELDQFPFLSHIYSQADADCIQRVLDQRQSALLKLLEKKPGYRQQFKSHLASSFMPAFRVYDQLNTLGVFSDLAFIFLMENIECTTGKHAPIFARGFSRLICCGITDKEDLLLFLEHAKYKDSLMDMFEELAGENLLSPELYRAIMEKAMYSPNLLESNKALVLADVELSVDFYFILLKHAKDSVKLTHAVIQLHLAGMIEGQTAQDGAYIAKLVSHIAFIDKLYSALCLLNSKGYLCEETYQHVLLHASTAEQAAAEMVQLFDYRTSPQAMGMRLFGQSGLTAAATHPSEAPSAMPLMKFSAQ